MMGGTKKFMDGHNTIHRLKIDSLLLYLKVITSELSMHTEA